MLLLLALPAAALEFHHTEQAAIAAFPEGVQVIAEPEWRAQLYAPAASGLGRALTEGNATSFVTHVEVTPSFVRIGPVWRFAPVAVWDLAVGAYGAWYFGTFSSLLPLDDPETVADRAWKKEAIAGGDREGGGGLQAWATTRLKARAGPVIAVAELTVQRNDLYTYANDLDWYWDPTDQVNARAHGWVVRRAGYLFGELIRPDGPTGRKLWVGALANWNSTRASGDRNIRLGPVAIWKPTDATDMPSFLFGSQAWVDSRFHDTWPPYSFLAARWEN